MYSSSCVSKHLIFVPILAVVAIQLLLIRSVSCLNITNAYLNHKCMDSQGKYKPGSAYDKNLNSILSSIASTSNNTAGYSMKSISNGPDGNISAILQCRGDSYGSKCRGCYATALAGLRRRCPRYKAGIIWYDQCHLDISAVDSVGKIHYENNFCMSNAKNVTDEKDTFDETWFTLLGNLSSIAVNYEKNYRNPAPMYAAGERRFEKDKVYGMVQCTKDLSPRACQECLKSKLLRLQNCLYQRRGARVVGRSCIFRFEFYPFVTTTPAHKYFISQVSQA